jgi:hypothetical protein
MEEDSTPLTITPRHSVRTRARLPGLIGTRDSSPQLEKVVKSEVIIVLFLKLSPSVQTQS